MKVFLLLALFSVAAGARERIALGRGALRIDGQPFAIRGVGYAGITACQFARDLPLIASLGANTVRTGVLAAGDERYFLPLLESTGLHWLAGFPTSAGLNAFARYVERVGAHDRLIAFVLDPGDARAELDTFVAGAVRVLDRAHSPALLAAVAGEGDLGRVIAGLDFWMDDGAAGDPKDAAALPVLIGSFGAGGSEQEQAVSAAVTAERIVKAGRLGGVYARLASADVSRPALMTSAQEGGPETLRPRAAYYRLAAVWGGTYPLAWSEAAAPELERVETETAAAAGSVVRLSGAQLVASTAPFADESWPFALGGSCVCIDGTAARMSRVSRASVVLQIPAASEPGDRRIVFYRAGQASNSIPVRIRISSGGGMVAPPVEVD